MNLIDTGNNNVDITKELPTVLSLCSGYGGIERGLDLAGFKHRVIAFSEIEAFAIANLVNKMEANLLSPAPVYTNLKTLPVECFRDRVDLITGGYPCQPFSAAGQRKGTDDPRHLWPYIKEIIRAVRPVRCFFENVEGHISLGLREVISDLESLGYKVAWGIFSAREVGAPHQRKRVYIMADSNNGQRELKDEEIRARWDSAVDGSADLADPSSEGSQGSQRLGKARAERFSRGLTAECNNQLADTICTRSETRLPGQERSDKEGNAGIADNCDSEQGGWQIGMHWPPEPGLGRVVDGCADRVDRIRLLGNGIVPATAAKAWLTLQQKIEDSTFA
jgi:DNA (cytosine-5)-methyltransferase 1